MENSYLSALAYEITPLLLGRAVARILANRAELLLDFRIPNGRYLFLSLDPTYPAVFLALEAELSDRFEGQSAHPFLLMLRKKLLGARLTGLSKPAGDRVVSLDFERFDLSGERRKLSLILTLTGKSSNAFITDEARRIEAVWMPRGGFAAGDIIEAGAKGLDASELIQSVDQSMGIEEIIEKYFKSELRFGPLIEKEFLARAAEQSPAAAFRSVVEDMFLKSPSPLVYSLVPLGEVGRRPVSVRGGLLLSHFELAQARGMRRKQFGSLSEAAEAFYRARADALKFQSDFQRVRKDINAEIKKRESLTAALMMDRSRHDDPDHLKRCGDLLLANIGSARIEGSSVKVIDYYDPDQREIAIETGEATTLQQAASHYFARYQKARRAIVAIESRTSEIDVDLAVLRELLQELDREPTTEAIARVEARLDSLLKRQRGRRGQRQSQRQSGVKSQREGGRWFISSDGYEMVVGRNDRENDSITFRLARPQDIWLHAADYPGSHVVIRNPRRADVAHRTIIEAASLAAYYSGARRDGKVSVHYTMRKFVSKPPRAKPGLVRLSSFKTLMVEPRADLDRLD
jgi:predicted ribosome quality control (RQC) complex YloA/Tae2 family protein